MKKKTDKIVQNNAPVEEVVSAKAQKKTGVMAVIGRVAKYLTVLIVVGVLFWFGFTHTVREGEQ